MAEYIEREAILGLYVDGKYDTDDYRVPVPVIIQNIKDIPAADVRPVVWGKWIDRDDKYYGWNMWACSACGEEFVLTEGTPDMNEYHFCPNCGADMREES